MADTTANAATYEPTGGYRLPEDVTLDGKRLAAMLTDYIANQVPRFVSLRDAYEGRHAILRQKAKAAYKPDNKLVANYAKQIVDSFSVFPSVLLQMMKSSHNTSKHGVRPMILTI